MTSATDDELFASLGTSLMRDLLSDIEGGSSASSIHNPQAAGSSSANAISDNMMNTLSILEEELDKQQQQQQQQTVQTHVIPPTAAAATTTSSSSPSSPKFTSLPPPGLRPPGLSEPSVAAMVVHHASTIDTPQPPQPPQPRRNGSGGGDDAWGKALHQFSALSLTEDFLKADSARKHQNVRRSNNAAPNHHQQHNPNSIGNSVSKDAAELVDRLLFDEDDDNNKQKNKKEEHIEEYDITASLTLPPGMATGGITSVEKTAPGFFAPISPSSGGTSGTASPVEGLGGATSPMPPPPPQQQPQPQILQAIPLRQPQPPQGLPPAMGTPTPGTMPSPQPPRTNMGVAMPPPPPPPPPRMMAMMSPPPNTMMNNTNNSQLPVPPPGVMPHHPQLHPHMVVPPPHVLQQQHQHQRQMHHQYPNGSPFPSAPGMHNRMSSPQQPHLPQPPPPMGPYPPHMLPHHPPPNQNNPKNKPSFNASPSDFPALTTNPPPPQSHPNPTPPQPPQPLPPTRIRFQNPSPTAPPIPAALIASHSMTSRDLCHVLHSMMRPMLALDPYNADYYRWSYDDRKSRNLLFLGGGNDGVAVLPNGGVVPAGVAGVVGGGGGGVGGRIDLPNPVWKETKIKAREIDETFRSNVEKRAADWSKEKHILGKTVKNNVKRPRAMLAAGTLSSAVLLGGGGGGEDKVDDEDGGGGEEEDEDDRQRARMWAARLASDRGYLAYLNLVELRRLLQSRPDESAALMGASTGGGGGGGYENGAEMSIETRREELLFDVEENVAKLHGALGITKRRAEEEHGGVGKESSRRLPVIHVNDEVLARTLSLPKGRMLLSRVIDEGILPHPSACRVLPAAIGVLLRFVVNAHKKNKAGGSVAPPPGEDRLLRSLTGLVRTVQPVDGRNVLRCLETVNAIGKEMMNAGGSGEAGGENRQTIRDILSGKRTLMELLHAILSLGGEVCVGPVAVAKAAGGASLEEDWKTNETEFLSMLSS